MLSGSRTCTILCPLSIKSRHLTSSFILYLKLSEAEGGFRCFLRAAYSPRCYGSEDIFLDLPFSRPRLRGSFSLRGRPLKSILTKSSIAARTNWLEELRQKGPGPTSRTQRNERFNIINTPLQKTSTLTIPNWCLIISALKFPLKFHLNFNNLASQRVHIRQQMQEWLGTWYQLRQNLINSSDKIINEIPKKGPIYTDLLGEIALNEKISDHPPQTFLYIHLIPHAGHVDLNLAYLLIQKPRKNCLIIQNSG